RGDSARRAFATSARPCAPNRGNEKGMAGRASRHPSQDRPNGGRRATRKSSVAREMGDRVDRGLALADLEMELRRGNVAGLAGGGDDLAALHLLAALHAERAVMGVGRDVAVVMPDEDEVAVA